MKNIILLSVCTLLIIFQQSKAVSFELYHSLGMINLPEKKLEDIGFTKIELFGHSDLWQKNDTFKPKPNLERIKDIAKESEKKGSKLVTLNIELWNFDLNKPVELEENIKRMMVVSDAFREYAPDTKFGFYRVLPKRNYHDPVNYKKNKKNKKNDWEMLNSELKSIAEKVDVIFPSIYTFYKKP